jgi:hypothetical protein
MRALHAHVLAPQGAAQAGRRAAPRMPVSAAAVLAAPLHAARAPAHLARHAPARRAAPRRAPVAARAVHNAPVVAASAPATAPPGVDPLLHSYRRLQNGSDVRGVALPGVTGQDVTLDTDRCGRGARGVGAFHKGQRADLFRFLVRRALRCSPLQRRLHRAHLRRLAGRQDGTPRLGAARVGVPPVTPLCAKRYRAHLTLSG